MRAVCTLVVCPPLPMRHQSAPSSATHWQQWEATLQDQVRDWPWLGDKRRGLGGRERAGEWHHLGAFLVI
jgi:hypothetical protein